MSPDELRALAEALRKMRWHLMSIDDACDLEHAADYLLACADEQPVMQFVESQGAYTFEFLRSLTIKPGDLFYLHPAPAVPQAEPCIGNDPACPCQDGDPCHYRDTETTKAWPIPQVDQKREPWSGYEAGHRAGYALALTERRTDDCTFETDTPDEHTHIEEVRALLRGDTGLKEQAKPPRQAGQEISLGALMREQRQSRIVAGAYPDGNPNAGAMMAQTPQAETKREPSEKQIADACLRYRHDFGLLDKYERDCIVNEAWRWADAFGIGGSDE